MFEPEVFRKEIYCIEESTCDIVGTFRRPQQTFGALHSDLAPGELFPLYPRRYAPESADYKWLKHVINREVYSQPVLVVQKVERNCLKSFR